MVPKTSGGKIIKNMPTYSKKQAHYSTHPISPDLRVYESKITANSSVQKKRFQCIKFTIYSYSNVLVLLNRYCLFLVSLFTESGLRLGPRASNI